MLSIIVPTLNEAESLTLLHQEISRVAESLPLPIEILFVDDGSTDRSWAVIQALAQEDARVFGIKLRRNFGKASALTAGMRAARGNLILMMDADLQDDPAEIPNLLKKLDEGYDVVNGWKQTRHDPWHKVYPSRVFNWMIGRLTGLWLHDHNCGLKLYKAEVASEIRIYGELHRFIAVLAHARGFRVAEIPVHHRPRQYGHSKYGIRRFLRGFLDLLTVTFLTGFGHRPQHVLGAIGICFFGLGSLGLLYLSLVWIFTHVIPILDAGPIGSRPLLAYSIAAAILGGQALSLGLLAEMIVAYTGRESEMYSIADRTALPTPEDGTPPAVVKW